MSSNPRIAYEMADQRRPLKGPDGKSLIVHLVVNVEHWQFDASMPRKIITAPHGAEQVPDIPNFCWAEYGMRAGLPRILQMFVDRQLPASTSINAGVIDSYPAPPRLCARPAGNLSVTVSSNAACSQKITKPP